ncbi:MAG TPA: hypothetical protein VF230_13150 [Acidimicrobiales bacterium]
MAGVRRSGWKPALQAAALTLGDVVEGKVREGPPLIEQQPGEGDPIDLYLDPFDPRLTVAFVRPWLAR